MAIVVLMRAYLLDVLTPADSETYAKRAVEEFGEDRASWLATGAYLPRGESAG